MARSTKIKHWFEIVKNTQKQGAWLLIWTREVPPNRKEDGTLTVSLEDLEASQGASAWTTAMAAKRAAAATVGRSRLTWADPNGDGLTLTAEYEARISE